MQQYRRLARHQQRSTHAWTATHQWISRLSQMLLQKCNIFLLIMDSPGGYRAVTCILESFRRADVKLELTTLRLTAFEIFAAKWQKSVCKRPKIIHPKPFLTTHLETPKAIVTKMGEETSGTQLYHDAKFNSARPHRRRDICSQTNTQQNYSRF